MIPMHDAFNPCVDFQWNQINYGNNIRDPMHNGLNTCVVCQWFQTTMEANVNNSGHALIPTKKVYKVISGSIDVAPGSYVFVESAACPKQVLGSYEGTCFCAISNWECPLQSRTTNSNSTNTCIFPNQRTHVMKLIDIIHGNIINFPVQRMSVMKWNSWIIGIQLNIYRHFPI